jgi:hypothetical protein
MDVTLPPSPSPALTGTPSIEPASTPVSAPSATPDLSLFDVNRWEQASPDGNWNAEGITAIPNPQSGSGEFYYTQLKITSKDRKREWTVVDGWSNYGLGYTTPSIYRWSPDGQHVYVIDSATPDGCAIYGLSSNMRRLNLMDGNIDSIAPHLFGVLDLSSDENTLVAITYNQVIWHYLDTGEVNSVDYQVDALTWQGGNPVWSPDGKSLLFSAVSDACSQPPFTSIFRVDFDTNSLTVLLDKSEHLFHIESWPETGLIHLKEQNNLGESRWLLNPESGQLTPES